MIRSHFRLALATQCSSLLAAWRLRLLREITRPSTSIKYSDPVCSRLIVRLPAVCQSRYGRQLPAQIRIRRSFT